LTAKQRSEIAALAQAHNLKFAVLFGSRAVGENIRGDSDYDIAVFSRRPERLFSADLDYYNGILFGLAKIFEAPGDKIDLTDLRHADPLLRYEITRVGKLLVGDELEYEELKATARRRYLETEDLREVRRALINRRQKLLLA